MVETGQAIKPGITLEMDLQQKMLDAGLTVDEIKVISVFRHVYFGHLTVYKRAGKLEGRIEFRETV